MNTQARGVVQTQKATTPTVTPPKSTLLQRSCACGESAGIDGLCPDCRDKRLTSPHASQLPTTPPLIQKKPTPSLQASSSGPNRSGNSTIGHNFSRLSIHAPLPEGIQAKLTVNQPGDQYEQEADHVAEQVMRMTASGRSLTPAPPGDDESKGNSFMRKQATTAHESKDVPSIVHDVLRSEGGQPLDTTARSFMEPRFGHDFSRVRIHTDAQAAESARTVNALAYTVGRNIVFGRGQYAPATNAGRRLLAHELTHVVQQQAVGPTLQKSTRTPVTEPLEQETQPPSAAHNEQVTVHERTGAPQVQREEQSLWSRGVSAVGGGLKAAESAIVGGAEAAGSAIASGARVVGEFVEDQAWNLLNKIAPELVPILRQGVGEWLKEKISSAFDRVFNTVMAPVHEVAGVVQSLSTHLSNLIAWMQDAAVKISKGDCSSISEAAAKISQVIDGISSPIVNRVKQLTQRAGNAFTKLWDHFGKPAWNFLSEHGGEAWQKIQAFASSIWQKTAPIRDLGDRAWTWFKKKLGVAEGPEGQHGLLQWVQQKASDAWNWLKAKIEPFKKPLLAIGKVLLLLSPAGPFIALGAGVSKLITGIRWIREHWHTPQFIIQLRETLSHTVIPAIMDAIHSVTETLHHVTGFITSKLGEVLAGFEQVIKVLADPILSFARNAVHWIADQFRALAQVVGEKLTGLSNWVSTELNSLRARLQPVWEVLRKIISFAANPLSGLGGLLTGVAWRSLPQCLKSIIINFILDVFITMVRFGRFLDRVIPGLGPLMFLIQTAMLGFLRKVRSYNDDVKTAIADRFARLAVEGSFQFSKGYLWGLVLGLWDGISGPFIFIWDIIKLIGGLFKFLWRTVEAMAKPETYRRILQGLENAWQTIQTQVVPAIEELLSGKTNPMKIIGFITSIVDKALKAVEGVGASVADALIGMIQQSDDEKLGEGIGRVTGNILFEVILTVATEGLYAARTAVAKLASQIAEGVGTAVREFVALFPRILKVIEGVGDFAANNRAVRAIIEAVKSLLRGVLHFIETSYGLTGAAERGLEKGEGALAKGEGALEKGETALGKGERVADEVQKVTVVDALTGETHELTLLADGRIIRCSDRCMEIVDSIIERSTLLKSGGVTSEVAGQLATIEKKAQAIAKLPEAERVAKKAELLKEAEKIEREMQKVEQSVLKEGVIKGGQRYFAEANLRGSGKHGLDWTEGPARAIKEMKPQGKFASAADVNFAVQKGADLGLGGEGHFVLPAGSSSIVYMPPDGRIVPAKGIFVKVYPSGKVHAFPEP